ncbi:hypothetical protein ACOIE4_005265 [Klebsiella variicola]|jgi:hypothetical protein|uniref:Uncharacterized protein n=3 Tax=Klebsiella pneumoniae complex TaxID=3390273 RepID=A0A7H0EN17_KLEVA|nr:MULTISPECIES: hypothetical protein [Klebsiella]MBE8941492.1 hypothetical protein [Escherichia coli]MVX82704.1 hypothetical protein [Enterobacteriaceae bacterium 8376wD9]MVY25741.1 hypothetical protein [Enterobacteriaceae bacterium 8376wB8]MVY31222.1 hypothetical protein [Enterobacteriaceae bacterium 8376wD8]EIW9274539.1 hypothetical protein [Klebsiella variicola]
MSNEHGLTMLIGSAQGKMQFSRVDGALRIYWQRYGACTAHYREDAQIPVMIF